MQSNKEIKRSSQNRLEKKERFEELVAEFKKTCASEQEAKDFALTAINLSNAFPQERSIELKYNFLNQIRPQSNVSKYKFLFATLAAVALFFLLGVQVNASKMGQSLYPVKIAASKLINQAKEGIFSPVTQHNKKPKVNNDLSTEKEKEVIEKAEKNDPVATDDSKNLKQNVEEHVSQIQQAEKAQNDNNRVESVDNLLQNIIPTTVPVPGL